jgi:glutathione reductase (NADPH)
MVIIGSGIVALEMAQAFATFGSQVTVLSRSERILSSSSRGEGREGDGTEEAAQVMQRALEKEGVTFLKNVVVKEVRTLREAPDDATIVASMGGDNDEGREDGYLHQSNLLPLMQLSLTCDDNTIDGETSTTKEIELKCECLLLAMGRVANVQNMGLEIGNVQYHPTDGILVNDYAQSISNPNVYAVGDCVAHVPRLTHS